MSELEESQLEGYNHRMLKPPFVCPICEQQPACITTTSWRSCMDCYIEMRMEAKQ